MEVFHINELGSGRRRWEGRRKKEMGRETEVGKETDRAR